MIVSQKLIPTLKKVMFTATAVMALMQCSQEDELLTTAAPDSAIEATSGKEVLSVSSLTVTGSNTEFVTLKDCKTCTYIVSAKEQVLDGKVLGFKPGSIICLNKGVKYGNMEFVNIDGTIENPVIIATISDEITSTIAADKSADPY